MAAQSTKSTLKKTVGLVALTATVGLVTYGTLHLVRVDAFANFAPTGTKADRLAFELTNVRITHYNGAKLVTMAMVDHVSVQKNRQNMFLEGIHDGVYRGEQGEFHFSGKTAEWNAVRKRLDVTTGAHVQSADFDLQVPHFEFDSIKSRLTVPGEIKGRISDGDIQAVDFAYNTKTHDWQVGKSHWVGMLALAQDGEKKPEREKWDIKGAHTTATKGIETTTDGTADNGETIVTAHTIKRNIKTKVIVATGNVFYYSTKANMTCDVATIYTEEKRVVLTGNVNMIVKPKNNDTKAKVEEIPPFRPMVPDAVAEARPAAPPPGEDEDPARSRKTLRKYPISVLADKIEYWYEKGKRHGIATGAPQAYQALPEDRWRRLWGTEADYDGEAETMLIKSTPDKIDVRIRMSTGDNYVADWFKMSTKDEENADDEYEANKLTGTYYNDNKNENNGPSKPPPGFDRANRIPKLPSGQPLKRTGSGGLQGPIGGQLLTRVPIKVVAVKHPVKVPKRFWPF